MARAASLAGMAQLVTAALVTINNTAPRLDNKGAIMDAHDCSIRVLPNGTYVMHAIEYGLCVAPTGQGCDQTPDHCGFRDNHNVSIWTSPDLSSGSWAFQGYAFPYTARPAGLIFRPEAIFNPHTGLWVLTYNQASGGNTYITSVSPTPFGPFSDFRVSNVTDATWSGGDFHLFIDAADNNAGYIIWTAMSSQPGLDHKIKIQRLTDDFRGADASFPPYMFSEQFTEAPMLFERGGIYYAVFGHCCCFCYQGSGLFVHTAPSPLGPWTLQSAPVDDVACEAAMDVSTGGIPTPGQGCLYGGSTEVSVTRSQQAFIATLPDGAGGFTFLEIGDRWGQSPDGLKGHEPQYVFPLQFNADGSIDHITWNNTVTFQVQVAA